jgi:hypothetical protein
MTFQTALAHHFPSTLRETDFVARTYQTLLRYGFGQHNTMACAGVCRDEISRPLASEAQKAWGKIFDCSSLAGMLFLGKTGFRAAQHHAPQIQGRERYVYYAFPHIAFGRGGEPGVCYRPGRSEPSGACGALIAFRQELERAQPPANLDPDDLELSLLRQRLRLKLPHGEVPSLIDLTRLAYEAILEDLEHLLALTVDAARSDYAVFTGIQVHAPDGSNYVWPGVLYAVVGGKRQPISVEG